MKRIKKLSVATLLTLITTMFLICCSSENNYVSKDLELFDLKGHVSECTMSDGLGMMSDKVNIKFTEGGELEYVSNDKKTYAYDRNSDGRISTLYDKDALDMRFEFKFVYDEEGKVIKETGYYMHSPFEVSYTNEDGRLKSKDSESWYEEGGDKLISTYTYKDFDDNGNWLVCEIQEKHIEYGFDGVNFVENNTTERTYFVTREIIYYDDVEDSSMFSDAIKASDANEEKENSNETVDYSTSSNTGTYNSNENIQKQEIKGWSYIEFQNEFDVRSYLVSHKFESSEGDVISFSNNANELYYNGQCLTSAVQIVDLRTYGAILKGKGPYGTSTFALVVEEAHALVDVNDRTTYLEVK